MKSLFYILVLSYGFSFSQNDTEIFMIDISMEDETFEISNFRNISNNPGYDSQPSFIGNEKLIYAGTDNNQTEIIIKQLDSDLKFRMNSPTPGGEYSPQQFPTKNEIAAVRLDTTGLQRLYSYQYTDSGLGTSRLLIPKLEVAYFAFYDDQRIIASILAGNQLDLVAANLETNEVTPLLENAGRSIHKIPDSPSVSFTAVNEEGNMDIFIIDLEGDKQPYFVCQLPVGIQDHCWLSDTQLLLGSGSKLYLYDLFGNMKWEEIADLSSFKISEISRITVSPDGKKLAFVSEKLD